MIYARKNNKMPEFYTIFARIWGDNCPLPFVSYAYASIAIAIHVVFT